MLLKDEDGDEVMNEEDLPKGPFLEDDNQLGDIPRTMHTSTPSRIYGSQPGQTHKHSHDEATEASRAFCHAYWT